VLARISHPQAYACNSGGRVTIRAMRDSSAGRLVVFDVRPAPLILELFSS
jgi:hypothetical protein